MNLLTLFGGIGAPEQALLNIGAKVSQVGYVEWDKFAVNSYNSINGTSYEPQDINDFDSGTVSDVDIIVHGSPCQSFSVAGKQEGGNEGTGTQSSLLYKSIEIIIDTTPKYVLWENVKNVLSDKHRHNFDNYLETLEELGYINYWKVLNAKCYGVPQNRERVFCVSILGDHVPYVFPEEIELELRLRDVLEDEVDEKFYLNATYQKRFEESQPISATDIKIIGTTVNPEAKGTNCRHWVHDTNGIIGTLPATDHKQPKQVLTPSIKMLGLLDIKGNEQIRRVYGADGISPCLNTMQGGNRQPKVVCYGNMVRDLADREEFVPIPSCVAQRGRNPKNSSDRTPGASTVQRLELNRNGTTNTLTTVQKDNLILDPRIRKLTPLECWRLMGFSDEVFRNAESVNSNSQLYKQAGNSIVVPVLEAIFRNLFYEDKHQ